MSTLNTNFSELDIAYNYSDKSPVIDGFDKITEWVRLGWGAQVVDARTLDVEMDSTAQKIGKAVLFVLILPISVLFVICFLIKMAISASLNERVKVGAALNEARGRIDGSEGEIDGSVDRKELTEQFCKLVEQMKKQEAIALYDDNIGLLQEVSGMSNLVNKLRSQLESEDASSQVEALNTVMEPDNLNEAEGTEAEIRAQFFDLMGKHSADNDKEAFAFYDNHPSLLQDIAVSNLVAKRRSEEEGLVESRKDNSAVDHNSNNEDSDGDLARKILDGTGDFQNECPVQ